jgi:hypothetical protein
MGMVTESRVQIGPDAAGCQLRSRYRQITDQEPTLIGDEVLSGLRPVRPGRD